MASDASRRRGEGFSIGGLGAETRRQTRLSLGLILVLSVGIASAAASMVRQTAPAERHAASAPSAGAKAI